eukprot:4480456-Prymnesium_polylepis.1
MTSERALVALLAPDGRSTALALVGSAQVASARPVAVGSRADELAERAAARARVSLLLRPPGREGWRTACGLSASRRAAPLAR